MAGRESPKAESIRIRLNKTLRERGEDVQWALQRYAIERFLFRLGKSKHREKFVLKGATLFALWGGNLYRPTRDMDFTGYGIQTAEEAVACIQEVLETPVEEDGLQFESAALTAEPIRDDAEYHGFRIQFQATLGKSRIPMQIDIGFGNAIQPPPLDEDYPTLLGDAKPNIRSYPKEAVVAEKLHALVILGERNSRLKDFYDLCVLAQRFAFDSRRLSKAIAATFERRNTALQGPLPDGLTPRFYSDSARSGQWRTYLQRNGLPGAPGDFNAVGEILRNFLGPIWDELTNPRGMSGEWAPGGQWPWLKTDSAKILN
ncbi:MAG: nucleotidyl transferase AbiEii/AbiGii toxin family protein [Fibrobacteria bacterium]